MDHDSYHLCMLKGFRVKKKWIRMRQVKDNSVLYWSDKSENEKKWMDLKKI